MIRQRKELNLWRRIKWKRASSGRVGCACISVLGLSLREKGQPRKRSKKSNALPWRTASDRLNEKVGMGSAGQQISEEWKVCCSYRIIVIEEDVALLYQLSSSTSHSIYVEDPILGKDVPSMDHIQRYRNILRKTSMRASENVHAGCNHKDLYHYNQRYCNVISNE
ncbi:hypothetical protein Drorol1_Dr00011923 [Drosera rotundifolia]